MRTLRCAAKLVFASCLLAVAIGGAAADERALSGPEIDQLLSGNTVAGTNAKGAWQQYFDKGGSTRYVAGGDPPSNGAWKVMGDQYCSQWPPSESWACYAVTADTAADPPTITWIGDSGTRYPGKVKLGNTL